MAAGVWGALRRRLDPARQRPQLATWVQLKRFELPYGNSYAICGNVRDLLYYRLTLAEADLVELMDGTRSTGEIVVEHLQASGDLDLAAVADLVRLLHEGNFLTEHFVDVRRAVAESLHPETLNTRMRRFARTLSVEWSGTGRMVNWLHGHGLRFAFTKAGGAASAVVAVVGVAAMASVVASHRFHLTAQSVGIGFLILFLLNMLIIFIHEMGHAALLVHYGRKVKAAGFRIYFGAPSFFIESSDALLLERRQRILQAFAGPYFELVAAGVSSVVLWAFPGWWLAPVLYRFCLLNYLVALENLVPLLELDGYWILSDAIQVPDLRPRSLTFMRQDLWHKLRRRERFSRAEVGLGLYGTVGVLFTIACFYFGWFFWRRTFGDLVSKMWHAGPVGMGLLVLLAVFLTGPILRGGAQAARVIGRRVQGDWRAARFRSQRRWRVEAASLLDDQPIFSELPVEVLEDVAGRVRLRRAPLGSAVIRQGERADALYLVRKGVLEVVEEDPASGQARVLRRVQAGEAFGEMGLAAGAPRNATVRTTTPAELFVIDKGTFDRLLAERVAVPTVAPTMQQLTELRDLPAFSHLGAVDLDRLAEHGNWVNVAPGQVLMTQGAPGADFFVIASGRVEIVEDGRRLRERGPGEHVGEVALLLDRPRMATVRALTPVRAYRLDRPGFDALLRDAFRRGKLRPNVAVDRTWDH